MFWTLAMQNQIIIEKEKKPHKNGHNKGKWNILNNSVF